MIIFANSRVANPSWSLPPGTIDQASQLQMLINSLLYMQAHKVKIDCQWVLASMLYFPNEKLTSFTGSFRYVTHEVIIS